MNEIEKYYNKFNEDKRLLSRHGQVEFRVSVEYIQKYINNRKSLNIIDIGAGTGRYSEYFANQGHRVTAVELVQKNLSCIKQKNSNINAILGNALNLKKFTDEQFDITILFGPMYHLFTTQDKVKALSEAKRITKKGGIIFVAYILSNYALIRHGFMDNNIRQSFNEGKIDERFNVLTNEKDLYSYVNLSNIEEYNKITNLKRLKIISPDGPTDYIRPYINKLSEEDFELYIKYQLQNAERQDLIGASSHIVDILIKE